MSLTGWVLPLLLAAGASLFAGLVLGRPRPPRARQVAVRAAQAIGMNLAVVALCAAVLNDQYLFYVTWGDLLGTGGGAAAIVQRGASGVPKELPPAVAFPAASAALPPLPSPGKRWQAYTVTGARSRLSAQVLVQLP